MGPRNRVLHGGPDPPWEGAILGERVAHCKVYGHSAVLCANQLNEARRGWFALYFLSFVSDYLILFLPTYSLAIRHLWHRMAYNVLMCR